MEYLRKQLQDAIKQEPFALQTRWTKDAYSQYRSMRKWYAGNVMEEWNVHEEIRKADDYTVPFPTTWVWLKDVVGIFTVHNWPRVTATFYIITDQLPFLQKFSLVSVNDQQYSVRNRTNCNREVKLIITLTSLKILLQSVWFTLIHTDCKGCSNKDTCFMVELFC